MGLLEAIGHGADDPARETFQTLAAELQSGLALYWKTAGKIFDDSGIALHSPPPDYLGMEKNIFSTLFLSGSGKTTLLHCIAGLEVPDEGRIVCHGEDIFQLPEKERQQWLRTGVGVVFQSGNLLSYLTVSDNIAFPLQLGGWFRGDIAQRVDELLQRIALPHAGRALPHELSGGELQRVAVARAIAHRPRIVLADEPTASLDTATAAALIALLMAFSRQENTILLMSTHDPAVMAAADRTVFLKDGRIDIRPGDRP